jgi:hypothetical protein
MILKVVTKFFKQKIQEVVTESFLTYSISNFYT